MGPIGRTIGADPHHAVTLAAGRVRLCAALVAVALAGQAAMLRGYGLYDDPGALGVGLALLGLAFLTLPIALRAAAETPHARLALVGVVLLGAFARAAHFGDAAVLETDFHRYLLDGASALAGVNPFAHAPADTLASDGATIGLAPLSDAARATLEQVNHPHLRTIYPNTAQAAFLLAALIEPWSLDAWRVVLFAIDLGALAAMIALLRAIGRSPLWSAPYWLNPLAIKETAGAAHFEPLLALFLVLALWAAVARRPIAAAAALACAVGVKVWPILLAPLLARHCAPTLRAAIAPAMVFGALVVAAFASALLAPVDDRSGFGAFGAFWIANAPVFDLAQRGMAAAFGPDGVGAARIATALIPAAAALVVAWRHQRGAPERLLRDAAVVVIVLLLASPVKLPWYPLWLICLTPFLRPLPLAFITPAFLIYPLLHTTAHLPEPVPPSQSLVGWISAGTLWVCGLLFLSGRSDARR